MSGPERVLTRRELNRALLARQLLLQRASLTPARAVERLAGLQAQYTPSPYLSLWARLEEFRRASLTRALERRTLVKALLMRGTLHIVTPSDFWAFAAARRGRVPLPASYERLLPKARLEQLAAAALAELDGGTRRTFAELVELFRPHAEAPISPAFIWRRVQGTADIVHAVPSGTWGYHGEGVYRAARHAIPGEAPEADAALDVMVRRYLAAFGPATKQDVAQWTGIPRLGPIQESLDRLDLRRFRDEEDRLLYDLPRAPRPAADTPAPVRLVPRYDNLVLAHDDRTRILGDVPVARIVTKNAIVHATILVDGFVAGTWQLEKGRVALEPFDRLPAGTRRELVGEVRRLEEFAA
ncbi:MAG TPA: winged helix DNA-binding domain-containing protein [Gaiellaceae bacterium]|nr:winged helix DNA-binding domain-containing protein [Gaiellaceae bacterium]